ncbi:gp294 [Sphingomonas phage PAU]|uniref:gp294 n=1 Tax=Sphingomonas phage PAU TaxID=1150991 RepID=UPI00025734A5|nr:gp294 [Sphingomonas phage PAU]AFF28291.1 gp294 [Sphingomonas phage PAU]
MTYKDFEKIISVWKEDTINYIAITKKLGELGVHPSNLQDVSNPSSIKKHLIAYLITKCRVTYSSDLVSIYSSKTMGFIVYDKKNNFIFIDEIMINAFDLRNLPNEKEFYRKLM